MRRSTKVKDMWRIADISRFVDTWDEDDPGYDYVEVDSKQELQDILRMSTTPIGTVLSLESDAGIKLAIGLSERYGCLSVLYVKQRLQIRVFPRVVTATEPCLFRSEGVVSEVLPQDLLQADEVVHLALYFFENLSFPQGTITK